MLRALIADIESAFSKANADAGRTGRAARLQGPDETASFSSWLPYRAYLEDRQAFVNRDSLGFCLELRPQSGADEEMARILAALYAALPAGTGLQLHLFASPDVRAPLSRYAALRQFGNVAVIQEQAREVRGWVWLEQVGRDLRRTR